MCFQFAFVCFIGRGTDLSCVGVCVCERERGGERDVCVCERERVSELTRNHQCSWAITLNQVCRSFTTRIDLTDNSSCKKIIFILYIYIDKI